MGTALRLLGIGWYISICMVAGIFAGVHLDKWLDSGPIFILLGIAAGLISAGLGMYRMLIAVLERSKHLNDESDG
jgi:F0F1-type ATP synthase assembly protein I